MVLSSSADANRRQELHALLRRRRAVLDWASGSGPFAMAITPGESAAFTRLGRRYKYDLEFAEALALFAFRPARTTSPRRR
jgi:hypothetical protein